MSNILEISSTDPIEPEAEDVTSGGMLVTSYLDDYGIVDSYVKSYNIWISHELPEQISSVHVPVMDKDGAVQTGYVVFRDVIRKSPYITAMGQANYIQPAVARASKLDYEIAVYAQPYFVKMLNGVETGEEVRIGNNPVLICNLPCMVGSYLCNTVANPEQMLMNAEPSWYKGHFIMSGNEKALLSQEMLRLNFSFVTVEGKDKVSVVKTTVSTPRGTSIVKILLGKKSKEKMKFSMPSLGKSSKKKTDAEGITTETLSSDKRFRGFNAGIMFYLLLCRAYPLHDGMTVESFPYLIRTNPVVMMERVLSELYGGDQAHLRDVISRFGITLMRAEIGKPHDDYQTMHPIVDAYVRKKLGMVEAAWEDVQIKLDAMIQSDIFPNITPNHYGVMGDREGIVEVERSRAYSAGCMILDMIEHLAGRKEYHNRNSWSMKRVRCADMMRHLFLTSWRRLLTTVLYKNAKLRDKEKKKKLPFTTPELVVKHLTSSYITKIFQQSFNTINWGIKGVSTKANVVQAIKHDNLLAYYSMMTKIDVETSRQGTSITSRLPDPSQLGFVCFAETPEGDGCGLLKNLALTAMLTDEGDPNPIVTAMRMPENHHLTQSAEDGSYPSHKMMINGIYQCMCWGQQTKDVLVSLKRQGLIDRHTMIVLTMTKYLYINTNSSRIVRPLLIVNPVTQRLLVDEIEHNGRPLRDPITKKTLVPFVQMIELGAAEYLDPYEQEYVMLASDEDTLLKFYQDSSVIREEKEIAEETLAYMQEQLANDPSEENRLAVDDAQSRLANAISAYDKITRRSPYTHCELHPITMFGVSASMIPFIGHIPGARQTYQAAMYKQALGSSHPYYRSRFDGKHKDLTTPSIPLVTTELAPWFGLNRYPQGENVTLAFIALPNNQEDAIIANKSSIDRGMLSMTKTIVIREAFSRREGHNTTYLGRPESMRRNEDPARYKHLDVNGLPIRYSYVRQGDAVIGILQARGTEINNLSITLKVGEEGYVDDYIVTEDDRVTVVTIKIIATRLPMKGDKYATRYSQKGIIGDIVSPENLPFTSSGLVPDIIINPHSVPSRMTVGYPAEIIASIMAVIQGKRFNATAFSRFTDNDLRRVLVNYGFSSRGTQRMSSGITGEMMDAEIFIGPCYIQALKHHVADKIQMRGIGPINRVSRQAPGGRGRSGGVRFGEMELASLFMHGAPHMVLERMCTLSDKTRTILCKKCGTIASANYTQKKYTCTVCGPNDGQLAKTNVPYSLILLINLLSAAGIKLSLGTNDIVGTVGDEDDGEEEEEEGFDEEQELQDINI